MQRVGNIVSQSSAVCAASFDADTRDGDEELTKPWNQLQQDKRLMLSDKVHCQYVLYCSVFHLFLCLRWWLADEGIARSGCPSLPVCMIKFVSTTSYKLEVRGEIIRTVLCCIVYWSCAVISTLRWAVLTVLWIGFCHTGPISLCIDSFVFICVYFVCFCFILHSCCIIVSVVGWTWWDWSLILRNLSSFSALTLLVGSSRYDL